MLPQNEDATIIQGGKKNAMDASAKSKGPGLTYVVKGVDIETRWLHASMGHNAQTTTTLPEIAYPLLLPMSPTEDARLAPLRLAHTNVSEAAQTVVRNT